MRYDPIKNFEPVTRVAIFSSVIVTTPSLPAKNLKELIALGKSQELTLAVGNASGTVMGETLARQVGWKLLRVPFKSNPPAMTEVVAGRVNMMFTDIASAKGLLTAGTVRPIAVTTIKRSALMPDVPTVAESGVPDYDLSGWIALFAPTGTPRAVVDRLNAEVTKALQLPDVRTRLLDLGAEPAPMPVAEFAAWTQGEVNKWTRLVKEAGILPE
jgi:tripartite-type tricarboxylate transporter receptor subunit TctC